MTARGKALFELGQVAVTTGAQAALGMARDNRTAVYRASCLLYRHVTGDWGELDEHDQAVNDNALAEGGRLFSAYTVEGVKLWCITEADRSMTTLLTPEEY